MNEVERKLRARSFNISFRNKLKISSYHNFLTPQLQVFSTQLNSNTKALKKSASDNKLAKYCVYVCNIYV